MAFGRARADLRKYSLRSLDHYDEQIRPDRKPVPVADVIHDAAQDHGCILEASMLAMACSARSC